MKRSLILFLCLSFLNLYQIQATKSTSHNLLGKSYYQSRIANLSISVKERLQAYDSLIHIEDLSGNDSMVVELLIEKSNILDKKGSYTESLLCKQRALVLMDSLQETSHTRFAIRYQSLFDMARMAINTGFYEQASTCLYQILSKDQDTSLRIQTYSLLALLYINMDKAFLAQRCLDQASRLIKPGTEIDTADLFAYANNNAALQYYTKNYDSALSWMNTASAYARHCGIASQLTWNYNMSNIYLDLGNNNLAKEHLQTILSFRNNNEEASYLYALSAQNLAYLFSTENEYDSALKHYRLALKLATDIDAKKIQGSSLIEMANVYKSIGDCEQAWNLQKKGYELQESVVGEKAVNEILIQNNSFVSYKREMERQLMEQDLALAQLQNKNKTIMLVVLFFLFSFFLSLLLFSLRKLNKERHLAHTSYEEAMKNSSRLNLSVEENNRKLLQNSLQLNQLQEAVNHCRQSIKKLKALNHNKESKEIIDELDSALLNIQTGQNWNEFSLYFEKASPNFFAQLSARFPELSQNEQRICALLWIGLNSKEIASVTFRSHRTIETVVHSIRKKCKIPSEERTSAYLHRILESANPNSESNP